MFLSGTSCSHQPIRFCRGYTPGEIHMDPMAYPGNRIAPIFLDRAHRSAGNRCAPKSPRNPPRTDVDVMVYQPSRTGRSIQKSYDVHDLITNCSSGSHYLFRLTRIAESPTEEQKMNPLANWRSGWE
jgi:hypothetical protein